MNIRFCQHCRRAFVATAGYITICCAGCKRNAACGCIASAAANAYLKP